MNQAKITFDDNLRKIKEISAIYDYLDQHLKLDKSFTADILRSQIIYIESALDKFIHDVVIIGILEIYNGKRIVTDKLKAHPFKSGSLIEILTLVQNPDPDITVQIEIENIIRRELRLKFGFEAYQDPEKIKDALSYIWNEPHKFETVAEKMGIYSGSQQEKRGGLMRDLRLISQRRNQIAHEADINPATGEKRAISKEEVTASFDTIKNFCSKVYDLITDPSCYVSTT